MITKTLPFRIKAPNRLSKHPSRSQIGLLVWIEDRIRYDGLCDQYSLPVLQRESPGEEPRMETCPNAEDKVWDTLWSISLRICNIIQSESNRGFLQKHRCVLFSRHFQICFKKLIHIRLVEHEQEHTIPMGYVLFGHYLMCVMSDQCVWEFIKTVPGPARQKWRCLQREEDVLNHREISRLIIAAHI